MRFKDIIGTEEVTKPLVSMADTGRVAHAMLLYENEGCGALALALAYVQYLACPHRHDGDSCGECPSCNKVSKLIHPDLHFIFPVSSGSKASQSSRPTSESYLPQWRTLALGNPYFLESQLYEALGTENKSGNIAVAEAKYILEKLSFTSVEGGYKCVLVWLPEKMNAEAANRLLKIVEEPPVKTVFIFITHAPEKVLQTISSRCQSFRVLPLAKQEVRQVLCGRFGFSANDAEVYANISGGSIGVALRDAAETEEYGAYMDIFSDILRAAHGRDLLSVLESSEQIAALDSREKQKAFCAFSGDCLRKIYMIQQNMDSLANMKPQERDFFCMAATWCSPAFCERILGQLDKSSALIDRNVNAKIVFCDLADRIYLSI